MLWVLLGGFIIRLHFNCDSEVPAVGTGSTSINIISIKLKSNRLLELGFEHFVRVGSVKRIHKKITPYVLQHQECETSNFLKQVIVYLIQICSRKIN